MTNKISIYAICKNELQFVEKWYESMREADYIVVLDTGSTDGTYEKFLELAKKDKNLIVAQKVFNPWRFDIPRNAAMDLCPNDTTIYFSTDLDEVLEEGWAKVLREKWDPEKHTRGNYKYTWSHLENGQDGRIFVYDKIHNKDWRWKYPVHELLYRESTKNKYERDETLVVFNEIHLHHYPDQNKSRSNYLPLLEARATEDPDDYYGLIYLAHEYHYRKFYDKSIKLLNKIVTQYKDKYNTLELASCYLFMGDSYFAQKKFFEAIMNYGKAIFIDPTYREPYLGISSSYMELGRYNIALIYLKECLEKSYRHYTWLERDTSWSYDIYLQLSLASFYSGDKKDALIYTLKALSFDEDNVLLHKNLQLILKSINDDDYKK
jgi:tetratricopeptide (TPR) repeat protein